LGGDFAIARYYTNGYPDNTFGENGLESIDLNPYYDDEEEYRSGSEYPQSVAIQNDGKIIVAGYEIVSSGRYEFILLCT
jgi:hypothetical protein